ncbi:MAG: hypothetical protein KAR17_06300 [Cyclobacteriaceae bacterium]|nr:hypothetical protein [Cyclobacteriaceae bacterium]
MAGYSIIDYKDKDISYLDYRGMNENQMIQTLNEATERSIQDNKPRLLLTNITGTFVLPDFLKKAKEDGKRTKHLTLKSAIVGVDGPKKVLLKVYNYFVGNEMKPFHDEEEAKEWLVAE